jgi:hypothetical protein
VMDVLAQAINVLSTIGAHPPEFIVGFLAVIGVWLCVFVTNSRLVTLMKKIETLPPEEAKKLVQLALNVPVPEKINPDQWLRARRDRYYFIAFVISICAVTAIIAAAMYTASGRICANKEVRLVRSEGPLIPDAFDRNLPDKNSCTVSADAAD